MLGGWGGDKLFSSLENKPPTLLRFKCPILLMDKGRRATGLFCNRAGGERKTQPWCLYGTTGLLALSCTVPLCLPPALGRATSRYSVLLCAAGISPMGSSSTPLPHEDSKPGGRRGARGGEAEAGWKEGCGSFGRAVHPIHPKTSQDTAKPPKKEKRNNRPTVKQWRRATKIVRYHWGVACEGWGGSTASESPAREESPSHRALVLQENHKENKRGKKELGADGQCWRHAGGKAKTRRGGLYHGEEEWPRRATCCTVCVRLAVQLAEARGLKSNE